MASLSEVGYIKMSFDIPPGVRTLKKFLPPSVRTA